MITISSTSNQKIKNVIALQKKGKERTEQGCFVIEGKKMFFEILRDAPDRILEVFMTEAFFSENHITGGFCEDSFFLVSDSVMSAMAETKEPQGVIAKVKLPVFEGIDYRKEDGVFLALDDIRDPGNLGTILRTAEAAGVRAVLMSGGTVDLFNPKVVRSTMGAIFRVPTFYFLDLCRELSLWKKNGAVLYAAHLKGEKPYHEITYAKKTVILIGNEANGLSDEITKLSDVLVKIPMKGKAESLNAAVAAALFSFEACRSHSS